jgi:two-component system response regulator HydG
MQTILIVDDDVTFCLMLKTFLEKKGFSVTETFTFKDGFKAVQQTMYSVILTDIRLPENDGLELLTEIKKKSPQTPVILMTGYGDIRSAVKAIKMGAFEYVTKPINPDEILFTVQAAMRDSQDKGKVPPSLGYVTGISEMAIKMNEYISLVAPTNLSVLILGESGTGKEFVARKIHNESQRAAKPFIAIDCGALPKDLSASELFGHVKGSFTSAVSDKTGQFVEANGGTIFLDEIGNLGYEVQIQLLRAIQERKVRPVGGNKEINVDLRIIAATNEDLMKVVQKGEFREDLYHRLNEFTLQVPRLQHRQADLMIYANHFLSLANRELNRSVQEFDSHVINIFKSYAWPGNIRELKNVIRRAVLLSTGNIITSNVLPAELYDNQVNSITPVSGIESDNLKEAIDQIEFEKIKSVLEKVKYNKTKAAQILNIDRKTLYNKLRQYDIEG